MSDTYTLGRWFAWRPVRLMSGGWAWLRYVRLVYEPVGKPSEYYVRVKHCGYEGNGDE